MFASGKAITARTSALDNTDNAPASLDTGASGSYSSIKNCLRYFTIWKHLQR